MSLPEGLIVEISVDCEDWQSALPDHEQLVGRALEMIIAHVPQAGAFKDFAHLEISIVLCDDALIQELNRDYRKQDKPTNVLSFMGFEDEQIEQLLCEHADVPQRPFSLGELYISYQVMTSEAQAAGISLKDHFCHLVIHGLLHLLGYDHIADDDAELMERLESQMLGELGIDDPYSS